MWFVCKMLLTFFTVIAVDLVAVSLLTHKLRVWFPVWLDAHWATRTDPWVVYSQSYFAGIFFIPLLSVSLDRHVLRGRPGWVRPVFWTVAIGAFLPCLSWIPFDGDSSTDGQAARVVGAPAAHHRAR